MTKMGRRCPFSGRPSGSEVLRKSRLALYSSSAIVGSPGAGPGAARPDPRGLRVREAADHELLLAQTLDLHPAVAAAGDVTALRVFADDALVALPTRFPPQRRAVGPLVLRPAHPVGPVHHLPEDAL